MKILVTKCDVCTYEVTHPEDSFGVELHQDQEQNLELDVCGVECLYRALEETKWTKAMVVRRGKCRD